MKRRRKENGIISVGRKKAPWSVKSGCSATLGPASHREKGFRGSLTCRLPQGRRNYGTTWRESVSNQVGVGCSLSSTLISFLEILKCSLVALNRIFPIHHEKALNKLFYVFISHHIRLFLKLNLLLSGMLLNRGLFPSGQTEQVLGPPVQWGPQIYYPLK